MNGTCDRGDQWDFPLAADDPWGYGTEPVDALEGSTGTCPVTIGMVDG